MVHENREKILLDNQEYLICPFCTNRFINANSGKTRCPVCDASFEIDDSVECIFGDTESLRLQATGTICTTWGLVQAGDIPIACTVV